MPFDEYVALTEPEIATQQMLEAGLKDVLSTFLFGPITQRLLAGMSEAGTREIERITQMAGPVMGCPGLQVKYMYAFASKRNPSQVGLRFIGDFYPRARYVQQVVTTYEVSREPTGVPLGFYGRYDLYAVFVDDLSTNGPALCYAARYGNAPAEFVADWCDTADVQMLGLTQQPFTGDFYEDVAAFTECRRRAQSLGLVEI